MWKLNGGRRYVSSCVFGAAYFRPDPVKMQFEQNEILKNGIQYLLKTLKPNNGSEFAFWPEFGSKIRGWMDSEKKAKKLFYLFVVKKTVAQVNCDELRLDSCCNSCKRERDGDQLD